MSNNQQLTQSFTRKVGLFGATVVAPTILAATVGSSAFAGNVSAPITTPPPPSNENEPILSHQDPVILAACPQITDIKTVTIPAKRAETDRELRTIEDIDFPDISYRVTPAQARANTDSLITKLNTATQYDVLSIDINSSGGDKDLIEDFLDAAKTSLALITTNGLDQVGSAATLALLAGTPPQRNMTNQTKFITHAVRKGGFQRNQDGSYTLIRTIFEEDFNFTEEELSILVKAQEALDNNNLSDENSIAPVARLHDFDLTLQDLRDYRHYKSLKNDNDWLVEQYVDLSTTEITPECAESFTRGRNDYQHTGNTVLSLGFVDTVINFDEDINFLGTMTVREDDPRAIEYFANNQKIAENALTLQPFSPHP